MSPAARRSARWFAVLAIPALALVLYGSATAAPPAQAPSCSWVRLDNGESRTKLALAEVPGVGVLALGGADLRSGTADVKDDVHLLDLTGSASGTWTELRPTGSDPGDRAEHTLVLAPDAGRPRRLLTYGGVDTVPSGGTFTWHSPLSALGALGPAPAALSPLTVQRDTFELNIDATGAAAWSKIGAPGQPRADHSAIWYPDESSMIVFGGRSGEDAASAENSTWRLAMAGASPAWERLPAGVAPPSKRFAHTAVYDPDSKSMVVFGGTNDWTSGMDDVWTLDLSTGWNDALWSRQILAGSSPRARFGHGAVYLPDQKWMVVFGGTANGRQQLSDTWALDLSGALQWRELNIAGSRPSEVQYLGAAYSDVGGYAVFYGGQSGAANAAASRNAAWGLKCTGGAATDTPTAPTSETGTPTVTPGTPTQPPPGEIAVSGLVYDAAVGATAPISGAVVAVSVSVPHQPFSGTTGADGRYSLLVPADYANLVTRIEASAAGYVTMGQDITGDQLRQNPVRDFGLQPEAGALPDLIIERAGLHVQGYTGGCAIPPLVLEIRVTVRNQGTADAGPFKVRTDGGLEWQVTGLAAGQSLDLEPKVGGAREVTADPDNEVEESDETNNSFMIPQPTPPLVCTATPTDMPSGYRVFAPIVVKVSVLEPGPTAGPLATWTPVPSATDTAVPTPSATSSATPTVTDSPTASPTTAATATPGAPRPCPPPVVLCTPAPPGPTWTVTPCPPGEQCCPVCRTR